MIIRTGVLPRVLGWLGALIAVVLLVGGRRDRVDARRVLRLAFVGFVGFALWVLVVSVMMYRRRSEVAAPASAA